MLGNCSVYYKGSVIYPKSVFLGSDVHKSYDESHD